MADGFDISDADRKAADKFFRHEIRFVAGADSVPRLPDADLPEIAFAGRSNVGKSSLINSLTGRGGLARASNTPGRTQQINFFEFEGELRLVDLPGYGYAVASKEKVSAWNFLIEHYLASRENLMRVCVLVDSRHGLKAVDRETMGLLDRCGTPYIVVLTKTDKVKAAELKALIGDMEEELKEAKNAFPKVYCSSSVFTESLSELRALILKIAGLL